MLSSVLERFRAAPKPWLYAAFALAALAAMLLTSRMPRTTAERTPLEARMERILSGIDGVGTVSVMVTQGDGDAVTGVLLVCDGEVSPRAGIRLQRAVQTLLDVDLEDVSVIGACGECF